MLSIQEIKELIEALDKSSLTEFTLTDGDKVKLELKKQTVSPVPGTPVYSAPVYEMPFPAPAVAQPVSHPQPVTVKSSVQEESQAVPSSKNDNLIDVVSPMVGTFYSSPSPDTPNYVSVGSKVSKNTVVCIVEAMKLFNEIEAECDGEIAEVLVEKGQLVEYGQVLFRVRPSK